MDTDVQPGPVSGLSSPLTEVSRSPSPPSDLEQPSFTYPSPSCSSSDLSSLGSTPSPDAITAARMAMHTPPSTQQSDDDNDSPHPTKRRRLNDDRERNPAYLDLSAQKTYEDEQEQVDKLLKVLHKRRKIVVVAGAGISVSAGIPDFRSSTGLFKTLKREHNLKSSGKDLFDASVYKDGDSTTSFHAMIRNLSTATRDAQPTPFHHLLATLADEGRLLRLYSQNIDGIDTSLDPLRTQIPLPKKGPWPKTIQLHGSLERMTCTKCHTDSPFDAELFDGPSPPPCRNCEAMDGIRTQHAGKRSHGIGVLRPRMVLYNEHNPDDEAIGSVVKADLRTRPDALIVVGTTLKVPGVKRIVKEMCGIVRDRKDGVTVWINNDPPPALKDYEWDLVVRGPCDRVAALAAMRRWDEPEPKLEVVSEEEVERARKAHGVEVLIVPEVGRKKGAVENLQGVITPAPSPKLKTLAMAGQQAAATAGAGGKKQTTLAGGKRKAEDKKVAAKKAPTTKKAPAQKKAKQPPAKPAKSGIVLDFKVKKNIASGPVVQVKPDSKPASQKQAPAKDVFTITHEQVIDVMQPLSPSSARNNGSPPYAAPAPKNTATSAAGSHYVQIQIQSQNQNQTPRSGAKKGYVELMVDTSLTTPVRESPEERRRTITPPGPIPRGMMGLIDVDVGAPAGGSA